MSIFVFAEPFFTYSLHVLNIRRKKKLGNFLVVQWLGLSASIMGVPGSIPSQVTKIPQTTQHGKKKKKKKVNNKIGTFPS